MQPRVVGHGLPEIDTKRSRPGYSVRHPRGRRWRSREGARYFRHTFGVVTVARMILAAISAWMMDGVLAGRADTVAPLRL